MNTVDLQVQASQRLGFNAEYTMRLAEDLYTDGFISYPRTESRSYPKSFEPKPLLRTFAESEYYWRQASELLQRLRYTTLKPGEIEDHPPITPMKFTDRVENLNKMKDHCMLYDLIVRYFFATLSTDAELNIVTTKFKIGAGNYIERHSVMAHEGFTRYYELSREEIEQYNITDSSFDDSENYVVTKCRIQRWQTAPPEYLSEVELVQLMEENRIGTDGTIHRHIKNINKKNYVHAVDRGERIFIPTHLGVALAESFLEVDPEMVQPDIRAFIEALCNMVCSKLAEYCSIISEIKKLFKEKFKILEKTYEKICTRIKELKNNRNEPIEPIVALKKRECRRQQRGGDYLIEESTVATIEDLDHQDFESSSSEY